MQPSAREIKIVGPVQGLIVGDHNTVTLVFQNGEKRTVPFMAPQRPAYDLIGRKHILDELKEKIFSSGHAITALQGLPGAGKTAVAIALVYDHELLSHFQDGILWAGLGRQPLVPAILAKWAKALGVPEAEIAEAKTIERSAELIHSAIGMSHMLIVVDDAWESESALAFKVGGPNCAHILTTRLPDVGLNFAGEILSVMELDENDGSQLLAHFLPNVFDPDAEEVRTLVRAVGGLPLGLVLMGRYLKFEAHSGQSRRFLSALDLLRSAQSRLLLSRPQGPLERHPSLPEATPLSLLAIIKISEEALDRPLAHSLRVLSLFPPKPNTFSEDAAVAATEASASALDVLTDSGLLESAGSGRYTMHQTISDYGKLNFSDQASIERLATFYNGYLKQHTSDFVSLEEEAANILEALNLASVHGLESLLVDGIRSVYPFLETRGAYDLAKPLLSQAETAARRLDDRAKLAEILINLSRISVHRAEYERAEQALREALRLANESRNNLQAITSLRDLGSTLMKRTHYVEAEKYLLEALDLAPTLQEPRQVVIAVLLNLGALAGIQGDTRNAERHLLSALPLARDSSHTEYTAKILQNLGNIALARGRYAQATKFYNDALDSARQLGHRGTLAAVLRNLAGLANNAGQHYTAEQYAIEALRMAEQIGEPEQIAAILEILATAVGRMGRHQEAQDYVERSLRISTETHDELRISSALMESGDLLLAKGEIKQATKRLREALDIARSIPNRRLIALALYGLARVSAAEHKFAEARRLFKDSQVLFREIGEEDNVSRARAWLVRLLLWQVLAFFRMLKTTRLDG